MEQSEQMHFCVAHEPSKGGCEDHFTHILWTAEKHEPSNGKLKQLKQTLNV